MHRNTSPTAAYSPPIGPVADYLQGSNRIQQVLPVINHADLHFLAGPNLNPIGYPAQLELNPPSDGNYQALDDPRTNERSYKILETLPCPFSFDENSPCDYIGDNVRDLE